MSTNIRTLSGWTHRRGAGCAIPALLIVVTLLASSAGAQDVFHAQFDADAFGTGVALPSSFNPVAVPDVADDLVVLDRAEQNGNQIRFQAPPAGGFLTRSLRISHPQGFGSEPVFRAHPSASLGPYNSGFYTVTWSSSVEQVSRSSFAALVSPGGSSAFTVNYTLDARIAFQSGTGVTVTSIPYLVNVPQTFQAVVRMEKKTFDLYVDGTPVACGQPFQHATFDAISRFAATVAPPPASPAVEALALDNVRIARSAVANTPPALTPIPPQTVNEGALLQFTVSATDCDGDTLTFSMTNLPLGATFDRDTQTFSWVPNSAQGGGQYYPTVQVSDGSATTSAEVTITVNDTVADADGDGVPDGSHPVLGGPDNCQFVPNPGQFDVNQNGIGDACDNANQNQVAITARTDRSFYNLGALVTGIVSATFTISGTECVQIRTVDGNSIHFDKLFLNGAPVPRDQIVHPGGALAVSDLQQVCPGTPTTFSTNIPVNGAEAPYLFLPAGRYEGRFHYDSLGARDPDVDSAGNCTVAPTPEDPTPCLSVFQVESGVASTFFSVLDLTSALAETDALCSFIANTLLTDPQTKKDLAGKCRGIRDKIATESIGAACNQLNAFISAVQSYLSKKKITQTAADFMLARAARIKSLLACP